MRGCLEGHSALAYIRMPTVVQRCRRGRSPLLLLRYGLQAPVGFQSEGMPLG
jgi:hypothetical protein